MERSHTLSTSRRRARAPPERLTTAEDLEAALLRRGMKRSSVRTAILKTFAASEGHLTADDAGLANARAFGDGHSRFEPAGSDHHDHLICTRCHRVIELKNDEIERLQDETALRHGFEVTSHRLEL